MSAWCVIRGVLAYFSVKEKYLSRIILVGLMRTRDDGTFTNFHRNGIIFYDMYCRTHIRKAKLSYSICLIIRGKIKLWIRKILLLRNLGFAAD